MPPRKATVTDKFGKPIHIGDVVSSRARGGRQYGKVTDIVVTAEEAEQKGVKHPPKVIYEDQHGHVVSHNPEALAHGEDPDEPE